MLVLYTQSIRLRGLPESRGPCRGLSGCAAMLLGRIRGRWRRRRRRGRGWWRRRRRSWRRRRRWGRRWRRRWRRRGRRKTKNRRRLLTVCERGMVWDTKKHVCLMRRSGVLPDYELTEYAFALAKAERFNEAIEVLDLLQDPNTARALNYRGYATRKLGRTDEGIGYYLRSVALDPTYAQVREYLGEAYVTLGQSRPRQ